MYFTINGFLYTWTMKKKHNLLKIFDKNVNVLKEKRQFFTTPKWLIQPVHTTLHKLTYL